MEEIYESLIQDLMDKGFGSVDHWFDAQEINELRKALLTRYEEEQFKLAGVGDKFNVQKVTAIRNDEIKWLNKDSQIPVEQHFFSKIDAFVAYLNYTCFAGIRSYEFHYAVYDEGSFYKRHSDQFNNDDRRRFSFVMYLSQDWQEGDGGELVMYKEDEQVQIQPIPGRLVFFDSSIEHEVLLSQHQRLSLTGWMKTL